MPVLTQSFSPVTVQQIRLLASDKLYLSGSTQTQMAMVQHLADCLGVTEIEIAIIMGADQDEDAIDRYGRPRT